MHWDNLSLAGTTLPDVTRASIAPVDERVVNFGINGSAFHKLQYYKYAYTLEWEWMRVADYDALEAICNALSTKLFVYDKFPQSADPGVSVLAELSDRTPKAYYDGADYYSGVTLTLIEVDAR